jgi:uncharacterized damage-inducible protein DinB
MIGYGARDLADAFRTVRKNTIQIAEEIPEDRYDFVPAPDTRSVRQLLTHIAVADGLPRAVHGQKLTTLEGFNFPEFVQNVWAEERKPRSKAEVVTLLKENGSSFADWLESLSEEFLAERVAMRQGMQPASKTRFEMLLGVKEHEMHHRGQLMLIERMIGIVPHLTRQMQARFASRT